MVVFSHPNTSAAISELCISSSLVLNGQPVLFTLLSSAVAATAAVAAAAVAVAVAVAFADSVA